jgi:hypothetical protein
VIRLSGYASSERICLQRGEQFRAVLGLGDDEPLALEEAAQHEPDLRLIVHDEDVGVAFFVHRMCNPAMGLHRDHLGSDQSKVIAVQINRLARDFSRKPRHISPLGGTGSSAFRFWLSLSAFTKFYTRLHSHETPATRAWLAVPVNQQLTEENPHGPVLRAGRPRRLRAAFADHQP